MDSSKFAILLRRRFREIDTLPESDRKAIIRQAAAAERSKEGQAILRSLGGFPLSRRMAFSLRDRLRSTSRVIQMSLSRAVKTPPRKLVLAEMVRRQLPSGLTATESQIALEIAARHASPAVLAWVGEQVTGSRG